MTWPCGLIMNEGPWGEGNQDKLGLFCHCKMTPVLSGAGGPYDVALKDLDCRIQIFAEQHINIDLVDKTIGSLVTTAWEKYTIMIFDSRIKRPDPFLCEYFQWLAEQIDERINKNPRKPFYLK